MEKPLLDLLQGRQPARTPIWFMRQAGRYLSEYRAIREKAGGFLDLCYTPELAAEVTLQPIRRFGFDGAILFSDILVIPQALGLDLKFAQGEGPLLSTVTHEDDLAVLSTSKIDNTLHPVYETVRILKRELPANVTLIGFCGAPWTVASYMVAGRGTPDQAPIRIMAYEAPKLLDAVLDRVVEASIDYLCGQISAGADCLQIFDTWAGVVSGPEFGRWITEPTKRIVDGVRARYPDTVFIGFPKGCADKAAHYATVTGVNAVGFDWSTDLTKLDLPDTIASQGNLDPLCLVTGGTALDSAVDRIKAAAATRRHIFNLGHGIVPQTPIAHVEQALERFRGE